MRSIIVKNKPESVKEMSANTNQSNSKKYIEIGMGVLILLVIAGIIYMVFPRGEKGPVEDPIARLTSEEYNAFFASMYDISSYSEEDFAYHRGLQTTVLQTNFKTAEVLSSYIDTAFQSGNAIESVYLGLDPYGIWTNCSGKEEKWSAEVTAYMEQIENYPDVCFEVLLPYPSTEYWTSLSSEKLDTAFRCYEELGNEVMARPNASLHFMGSQEWLIANPGNYQKGICTIDEKLAHRVFLLNFCERMYAMNPESYDEALYTLQQYILSEKENPTKYVDLSDTYFVFFGDSVMTYELGTSSIPGVVFGLSGSQGANLSQGGSPASADPAAFISFERMVDAFLNQDIEAYNADSDFGAGLAKYIEDSNDKKMKKKKTCFVICLGLNDYFGAHPVSNEADPADVSNYKGALKNGILRLKEQYPDAHVLIMTPSYTKLYDGGTMTAGESGGVLLDYVDTAIAVADELQVDYVDVYHDSGITADTIDEYLAADGVHPKEEGRYLLGKLLVKHLGGTANEP